MATSLRDIPGGFHRQQDPMEPLLLWQTTSSSIAVQPNPEYITHEGLFIYVYRHFIYLTSPFNSSDLQKLDHIVFGDEFSQVKILDNKFRVEPRGEFMLLASSWYHVVPKLVQRYTVGLSSSHSFETFEFAVCLHLLLVLRFDEEKGEGYWEDLRPGSVRWDFRRDFKGCSCEIPKRLPTL